jgi:hypothetical protein
VPPQKEIPDLSLRFSHVEILRRKLFYTKKPPCKKSAKTRERRVTTRARIGEFQQGLEKIFGAGARFIEILIMKDLHSKIGLPLEINNLELEFIAYVNAARKAACQNNQQNQECPSVLITEEAHSGFIVALSKPDEIYSTNHPSVLHSTEKRKKSQQRSEARLGGEE